MTVLGSDCTTISIRVLYITNPEDHRGSERSNTLSIQYVMFNPTTPQRSCGLSIIIIIIIITACIYIGTALHYIHVDTIDPTDTRTEVIRMYVCW